MPELPDVTVYVERVADRVVGQTLEKVRLASPFLLRSVEPPLADSFGKRVVGMERLGKRIIFVLEDELFLVLHLMVAGRLKWLPGPGAKIPGKVGLAAFDFSSGTLILTEASSKKRASLHVVRGRTALGEHDRGGIEPLAATGKEFAAALRRENHTLKRTLTDPRIFSGIGNAYCDEILHRAKLSPVALSQKIDDDAVARLYAATCELLADWTERLRTGVAQQVSRERDRVPARVRGARQVPPAVPGVRQAGAAHPLRRERDQLLRGLPDRRQAARRSRAVAPAARRLAALARRDGRAARARPGHPRHGSSSADERRRTRRGRKGRRRACTRAAGETGPPS